MKDNFKYAQAYIEQGNRRFSRGCYRKAEESYKLALLYEPNLSKAYINLGLTYWKMGKFEEALTELEEGQALHPTNKNVSGYIEAVEKILEQNVGKRAEPRGLFAKIKSILPYSSS